MRNEYRQFADIYDMLMDDADYDTWAEGLAREMDSCFGKREGIRVVDCACGTGNIALRLARMGYDVTGLDISEDMLRVASEKQIALGTRIPLVRMDMTRMRLPYRADAATCCCDGVNCLLSEREAEAFFRSVFENLGDGGIFLFDISTEYKLEKVLGTNRMGEDRKECTYLWENMYDPASKLIRMDLHFFLPLENGNWKRIDETHVQRAWSAAEMESLLKDAGFGRIRCREAFTWKRPRAESERLQFTARKGNQ